MADLIELARLLEDYAAARRDFLREHAADFGSRQCALAYDRQEDIMERLTDEFEELVTDHAAKLASAVRAIDT